MSETQLSVRILTVACAVAFTPFATIAALGLTGAWAGVAMRDWFTLAMVFMMFVWGMRAGYGWALDDMKKSADSEG